MSPRVVAEAVGTGCIERGAASADVTGGVAVAGVGPVGDSWRGVRVEDEAIALASGQWRLCRMAVLAF